MSDALSDYVSDRPQIDVTVFGTATAADGSVTHVDLRSIRVAVESGDGTFTQDPATPMVFTAKAAGAEGETVYTVTGTQQNGPEDLRHGRLHGDGGGTGR